MEPLSITAGCAGLLTTILKTSVGLGGFVKDYREAKDDIEKVTQGLKQLKTVTDLLQGVVDEEDEELIPAKFRSWIVSITSECDKVLEDNNEVVGKSKGRLGRLRWTMEGKTEVLKLGQQLGEYRDTLDIAVTTVNIVVSKNVKRDTSAIRQDTEILRFESASLHKRMDRVLEEISRVRELLGDRSIILRRNLDSLTAYAESVRDDGTVNDDTCPTYHTTPPTSPYVPPVDKEPTDTENTSDTLFPSRSTPYFLSLQQKPERCKTPQPAQSATRQPGSYFQAEEYSKTKDRPVFRAMSMPPTLDHVNILIRPSSGTPTQNLPTQSYRTEEDYGSLQAPICQIVDDTLPHSTNPYSTEHNSKLSLVVSNVRTLTSDVPSCPYTPSAPSPPFSLSYSTQTLASVQLKLGPFGCFCSETTTRPNTEGCYYALLVWDMRTGTLVARIKLTERPEQYPHRRFYVGILLETWSTVAVGIPNNLKSPGGRVEVYNWKTRQLLQSVGIDDISNLIFQPQCQLENDYYFVCARPGKLWFWRYRHSDKSLVLTREEKIDIGNQYEVKGPIGLAFSPDGTSLAAAFGIDTPQHYQVVILLDTTGDYCSGSELPKEQLILPSPSKSSFSGQLSGGLDCQIATNGERVVTSWTGPEGVETVIWNAKTGQDSWHTGPWHSEAFISSDCKHLVLHDVEKHPNPTWYLFNLTGSFIANFQDVEGWKQGGLKYKPSLFVALSQYRVAWAIFPGPGCRVEVFGYRVIES